MLNRQVSYKNLWKLLIDKEMSKKKLGEESGVSPASIAKLGRNGNVTADVLVRICNALECELEDIMELVPQKGKPRKEL